MWVRSAGLIVTHILTAECVRDSRVVHGHFPPRAVLGRSLAAGPYPQVIKFAGAEHGKMTGVHARFPPKAGIRPGVYAGLHATARVSAPLAPAAGGGGSEGGGEQRSHWSTRAEARA